MFDFLATLPAIPDLTFVNAGAMSLGDEPYAHLLERGIGKVIGFEPVPEECEKLNSLHPSSRCVFLPYAIGDGSTGMFHRCNYPMTSSLLMPNVPLIEKFTGLEEFMQVVESTPMATRRLDDLSEITGADYLKLDVQGAELQILQGARETLKQIVMVHTEVEFVPLYQGQPLFAEIDSEMRAQGFLFHRFLDIKGRPFRPFSFAGGKTGTISQQLWTDAIYVRDFTKLADLSPQKLLKMAVLLHELYDSFDLCALALSAFDQMTGFRLYENYCKAVSS